MNEEIKEIEQYLKKCSNCFTCNNFLREDKNGGHCMLQNAYNYITNLQEENQKLVKVIGDIEKILQEKINGIKTIKEMLGKEATIVNPHIDVLEQEYNYFLNKLTELKGGSEND